jgi:tRNA threonylcarbamoyl adenosine modification protein YjeE
VSFTPTALVSLEVASPAGTADLGARLARLLEPGDVVLLHGELGAGKTTLVKAVVAALGSAEEVTSPTFTLLRTYATRPVVAHVDCWRLEQLHEVFDLGLEEILDEGGVAFIEWGEAAEPAFGRDALSLRLVVETSAELLHASTARRIELAAGPSWAERVQVLAAGGSLR